MHSPQLSIRDDPLAFILQEYPESLSRSSLNALQNQYGATIVMKPSTVAMEQYDTQLGLPSFCVPVMYKA